MRLATLGHARQHRQDRLCAVERLDLAFFIDTEHQRAVWRRQIEPDDVADLVLALPVRPRMSAVSVDRIQLLAAGPDGEKVTWSSHLGVMHEALIVARLFLSNGVEAIAGSTAYTEHEFDRTAFAAASLMAPFVLGRDAFDSAAAYADMRRRSVPLGHLATSLFDIALHDGKAKTLDRPLYRMLGAARHAVRAYASSPLPADPSLRSCARIAASDGRVSSSEAAAGQS